VPDEEAMAGRGERDRRNGDLAHIEVSRWPCLRESVGAAHLYSPMPRFRIRMSEKGPAGAEPLIWSHGLPRAHQALLANMTT
jgi:hypothetical protein